MVIAGEASGDMLAAELVEELRAAIARIPTYSPNVQPLEADLAPQFFGAGGPRMAEAGVELAFDMTQHSMIGLPGPRNYLKLRRRLNQLIALACEREPHAIICVDYQLFNSIFAAAIKKRVRARRGPFNNWEPRIIKYISPQVWASRERRAYKIARDFDLVLSIFPFEKDWYAARVPKLRVEFVGHPLVERHNQMERPVRSAELPASPNVLLLPGSRKRELERHWPVMLAAWQKIQAALPAARAKAVLPGEALAAMARSSSTQPVKVQVGGLAEALAEADLAISKTGTITMECAFFGVPTVAMYIASGITYQIGKRIVKVKSLTMPNLMANEEVFPEFIQDTATPDNISHAALQLLQNQSRRQKVRAKLVEVIASLGQPGASRRAAEAILAIMR
jgi:lipid-A-disaccharide synthase